MEENENVTAPESNLEQEINTKKLNKNRPEPLTPEEKKHVVYFRLTMIFALLSLVVIAGIAISIYLMVKGVK